MTRVFHRLQMRPSSSPHSTFSTSEKPLRLPPPHPGEAESPQSPPRTLLPASPGPGGFTFSRRDLRRARRQVSAHLGPEGGAMGGGEGAGSGRWPHPRGGGARAAGPMGRGARRPGLGHLPISSLPQRRLPRPTWFKVPRAAGGGAASLSGARRC